MVAVAQPDASPTDQPREVRLPARDRWGNWLPGHSGNPNGPAPGRVGLIRVISDRTGGGVELVEYALKVLRDPAEQTPLRLQALTFLANRLWGKPKESIEIEQVQKQLRIIIDARAQPQPDLPE